MEKEFIEIAIYENLNEAKRETNCEDLDGLCFYFANNIKHDLELMDMKVNMWNIRSLTSCDYDHYFLVVSGDGDYLIDPTYLQFLPKEGETPLAFEKFPADVLMQSEEGKELCFDLINKGYFEIKENEFDLYINSFKPKERKMYR